jgi:hypothetical protein
MRYSILLITLLLNANNSTLCKTCHPKIYSEYKESMHFKSTLDRDKAHNAIWQKHPLKAKDQYKCAKCHDPKIENKVDSGVDCISCHAIKDVKEHAKANENVYEKSAKTFYSKDVSRREKKVTYHKESSFFGMFSSVTGSPYHDIDYRNSGYYNGKMCMGCHSHLQNGSGFMQCELPNSGAQNEEQNCITCHMPKVAGSATTIKQTKTHAYHGFLGAYNKPNLLSKYIQLEIKKGKENFSVVVTNSTPHPLFTQPLRVAKLLVSVKNKQNLEFNKSIEFVKILGKDGKATSPALANSVIKDSMLKANQKREITFNYKPKEGDKISATLGYYAINPKVAKKLNLDEPKFVELKSKIAY